MWGFGVGGAIPAMEINMKRTWEMTWQLEVPMTLTYYSNNNPVLRTMQDFQYQPYEHTSCLFKGLRFRA